MQNTITKLVVLAGNQHKFQYFIAVMCFLYWFNFNMLGFSLAFLENVPMVSYFDKENNETVVESLDYDICDWEKDKYTIVETYDYSWIINLGIECEKLKVSLIGTFVSVGMLLGAVLYSYITKFLGQKKALLAANMCYVLFLLLCIFIENYVFYCIVCLITMVMCNIMSYSVMVLFTEIVDKKKKSNVATFINSGLGLGGIFYVLMFYAIKNWKYVFVICIGISVVIFILTFFFIFNSLKELVDNKEYDSFMKVLRYIAKFNGRLQYFEEELKKQEYQNLLKEIREGVIPIPISTPKSEAIESPRITDQKLELETKNRLTTNENQIITLNNNNANDNNSSNNDKNNNKDKISENSDKIIKKATTNLTNGSHNQKDAGLQKEKSSNKKKLSPLALLKYPSIRYTFLLFCILWFFSSGLYSGLTIGVKNLPGSIYLNSLLLFIAETPGYFISGIAMNNRILGRKYSLVMFTSLFTLGNLLLYILFNYEIPSIVIYLITRFFVVSAFVIYYTYSLESYPVSIAQLAYGINGSCNSLGGIVVPFVIEYVDNRTLYLIYAIFGIVCVLLMLLLKETNGQPVRDQIIEIEEEERKLKNENNGLPALIV